MRGFSPCIAAFFPQSTKKCFIGLLVHLNCLVMVNMTVWYCNRLVTYSESNSPFDQQLLLVESNPILKGIQRVPRMDFGIMQTVHLSTPFNHLKVLRNRKSGKRIGFVALLCWHWPLNAYWWSNASTTINLNNIWTRSAFTWAPMLTNRQGVAVTNVFWQLSSSTDWCLYLVLSLWITLIMFNMQHHGTVKNHAEHLCFTDLRLDSSFLLSCSC